jgi:hypothetical protein
MVWKGARVHSRLVAAKSANVRRKPIHLQLVFSLADLLGALDWTRTERGFSNPLFGGKSGQECPHSVAAW